VEALYDPWLNRVPAVTYRKNGPITSVNPLAKKKGIKTTMRISEALEIEPNLVRVEEHHQRYAEASERFYNFFRNRPGKVEGYSPDELFRDLSELSPVEATKEAQESLEEGREELHLRMTGCLAPNRILAKRGTNMAKPNGFLQIPLEQPLEESAKIFYHLPVEEFHGVGLKSGQRLRKDGFETIGDLGRAPLANLIGPFKIANGIKLYYLSRGIDILPFPWVIESRESIGHSLGPYDLDPEKKRHYFLDWEEIKFGFRLLAIKIAQEIENENSDGKTVSISLRFKETQKRRSKQKSVRPYFHDAEVMISVIEGELLPKLFTQKVIDMISLRITGLQKDRSQLRLL